MMELSRRHIIAPYHRYPIRGIVAPSLNGQGTFSQRLFVDVVIPMNVLEVNVLGAFHMTCDGQALTEAAPEKARALLTFLALEGTQSRTSLAALLWPYLPQEGAFANLRKTLYRLRQRLDESIPGIDDPVIANRHSLQLDPQHIDVDLLRFQTLLSQCDRHAHGALADCDACLARLAEAVDLYRGELLAGFGLGDAPAFEEWLLLRREMLQSQALLALAGLTTAWERRGDIERAHTYCSRALGLDPLREETQRQQMRLLVRLGQRNQALQQYEGLRRLLGEELGVEPDPTTTSLYDQIRRGEVQLPPVTLPSVRPQPTATKRSATPIQSAQNAMQAQPEPSVRGKLTRHPTDLNFVGRVGEFARLRVAYQTASHGQTQVFILEGEAGIGKTRLTSEFLHWATTQGADVLPSQTFETGGDVPYQPLAYLLRQRLEHEAAITDLLSTTWLAELSRLLPELRDRYPELPPLQPHDTTAQGRLLEAITRLGEALAERAPLILFIDDIQWADVSSLDALSYALSRWAEHKAPILLLLCMRSLVSTEKSNVRQWISSLKPRLPLSQMTLGTLTVEDTMALISSLDQGQGVTGDTPPKAEGKEIGEILSRRDRSASPKFTAFAQALFDETGGQPLYLVETIKTLLEQQLLIPTHSENGTPELRWRALTGESNGHFSLPRIIPSSVREAILDRLARLTPAAVAMLTAAAVLGQAATFRQMVEISSMDQMAGLNALEELVAKRLLLEADQRSQSYLIAHDKIRDVIYIETNAVRRQLLHSRAVTAIQGGGSPEGAARLAYHALAAGMDAEAFHYSIVAGDAALHLFAAVEAIAHYEAARKILAAGQLPPVELDKLRHLYLSLGRALDLNVQLERADAVFEELKTIAHQHANPAVELEALVDQLPLLFRISQLHNPIRGEALADEALNLARELGDLVAETKVLCCLIDGYRLANRFADAQRCGDQALALARKLNLRQQKAHIFQAMMKFYTLSARLELAEEIQRESIVLCRELNNSPILADCLASSALTARWAGKYDDAVTFSAEAYAISQSIADPWNQSYGQLTLGYVFWERGEPALAIAIMEETICLSEKVAYLAPQVLTRTDLGELYANLGDSQRGIEMMQLALDLCRRHFPSYQPYVSGLLARQFIRNGRLQEAEALIEPDKNAMKPQPVSLFFQLVRLAEAELALRRHNTAHALVLTQEILDVALQAGIRSLTPVVLHLRGQCFMATQQVEDARTSLLEARAEAERIGSRWMLLQILTTLAGIEPNPFQAEHLRQQAQEILEYIVSHTPPELQASFRASWARTKL